MKRFAKITCLKEYVGSDLVQRLVSIDPDGEEGVNFEMTYSAESDVLARILDLLRANHINVARRHTGANSCQISRWHRYDEADLDRAPLFRFGSDIGFLKKGSEIPPGDLRSSGGVVISTNGPVELIVADEVRAEIAERELVGAKTIPINDDGGSRYWLLTGEVQLPPLSPRCVIEGPRGSSYGGGRSDPCTLREGEFPQGEMHYRRSDLEPLGLFDFASSYEIFHSLSIERFRPLILSRRVYELFGDLGVAGLWTPVYVDDE